MIFPSRKMPLWIICFLLLFIGSQNLYSQDVHDTKTCIECHGEKDATGTVFGVEKSVYIDLERFNQSTHRDLECVSCHADIQETPHDEDLKRVDCSICHEEEFKIYSTSVHGAAVLQRNDQLAPTCASCHGSHSILPPSNPQSSLYVFNIPATCGSCHKEGSPMTTTHPIDEKNVISNYSMSIHGEGLFKRGLTVTAVCTSCHGTHNILPHQNPDSTINIANVAKTCEKCHAQIEQVHEKIVEGRLWKQNPDQVPACIDCHAPHKIRRAYKDGGPRISDETCLSCHKDPNLKMEKNGQSISLFIDSEKLSPSSHANIACVQCHYDIHPEENPVCKNSKPVDCAVCHSEHVTNYFQGVHGKLFAQKDPDAPSCVFCHGKHDVLSKKMTESPTFPRNVPALCSRCHADGQAASIRNATGEAHIQQSYMQSVHGKGLMESGLVVTAMCTDCHTPHKVLPAQDDDSTVNIDNLGKTCGKCHLGIYEEFRQSIHSKEVTKTDQKLPTCNNCHQSHAIARIDQNDFRSQIISQCGACHKELTESYFDTYHGKVSKLGSVAAAKCHDCHGSHNIFPATDDRSTLNRRHIVETCKKCHAGSNRKFTGYLTHATHHDKNRYPSLYYSFLFMTALLVGTLTFFGVHTLLWLIRSLVFHLRERDPLLKRPILQVGEGPYFRRFGIHHRATHFIAICSFLGLALTGMTLKFPDVELFGFIAKASGGPAVLGVFHRIGAVITFGYFFFHLFVLFLMWRNKEIVLKSLLGGENTMLPTWRDAAEMKQNFLWFFGKAEKPKFGRWTYWEKFDYFAVFWGVAIIGTTGLMLWFPEWVTLLLPGWTINIATVIHSDEALLAAAFIFTIHFFNTHFRPGIFPIDPVIFTGRIPLEEFKRERPREYQQLEASGELDKYIVGPPPDWLAWSALIFGFMFLAVGLVLIGCIIYGMYFAYL